MLTGHLAVEWQADRRLHCQLGVTSGVLSGEESWGHGSCWLRSGTV